MKKESKIRVYCNGGLGINIGLRYAAYEGVDICFTDTSKSNRTENLPDERTYFIPNLDGAGQDRKAILAAVVPHIDPILDRFQPGDFNIVLFSAAGGSGSVLGPLLVKTLLAEGETVVAIGVGADDAKRYLENTINTLKSLEAISAQTGKSVVYSYHENVQGVPRGETDKDVCFVLESMFELASQNNLELDTSDVTNWTQYHKVSPVMPQLAYLSVFDNRQAAAGVLEPISIASLYTDPSKRVAFGSPYYATSGFPRNPHSDMPEQLHFVIDHATIEDIDKNLAERLTNMERGHNSYRKRRAIVNVDDNVTSDSIVV